MDSDIRGRLSRRSTPTAPAAEKHKSQSFKAGVSNLSIVACIGLQMTFNGSKLQSLGPLFQFEILKTGRTPLKKLGDFHVPVEKLTPKPRARVGRTPKNLPIPRLRGPSARELLRRSRWSSPSAATISDGRFRSIPLGGPAPRSSPSNEARKCPKGEKALVFVPTGIPGGHPSS